MTPSDQRLLKRVLRPSWARLTLVLFIVIVVCGLLSLGLAVMHVAQISHAYQDSGPQPDLMRAISEAWLALLIGSTALTSAIFIWAARRYGLLIRKLHDPPDANKHLQPTPR